MAIVCVVDSSTVRTQREAFDCLCIRCAGNAAGVVAVCCCRDTCKDVDPSCVFVHGHVCMVPHMPPAQLVFVVLVNIQKMKRQGLSVDESQGGPILVMARAPFWSLHDGSFLPSECTFLMCVWKTVHIDESNDDDDDP